MILALEASTSSAKGILYQSNNEEMNTYAITYPDEAANVRTMDAARVFECLMEVASYLVQGFEADINQIVLVSIWNSLLFLDEQFKPLGRVKTWADTKGDPQLLDAYVDERGVSGCPKHYKFTRWKLLRDEDHRHINAGHKIASLPEYIYYRLTGRWSVSRMVAAGSGLLNLNTGNWNDNAVDSLGIAAKQLPELVDWHETAGLSITIAQALGLDNRVSVAVPGADGGLNQYAESGFETDIWSMSVGTSAALRCVSTSMNATQGLWCHYLTDGHYVVGATISGAGNCIQWFRSNIHDMDHFFEDMEALLQKVDMNALPIYLPFIYGEQSPGWVNERVSGYSRSVDAYQPAELYYSMLEGIVFNLYQGYSLMVMNEGIPSELIVSGGILKSDFWLQLAADIMGRPLRISAAEHSSLLGGIKVFREKALMTHHGKVIEPDLRRHEKLMERFGEYLDYYQSSKNTVEVMSRDGLVNDGRKK